MLMKYHPHQNAHAQMAALLSPTRHVDTVLARKGLVMRRTEVRLRDIISPATSSPKDHNSVVLAMQNMVLTVLCQLRTAGIDDHISSTKPRLWNPNYCAQLVPSMTKTWPRGIHSKCNPSLIGVQEHS